MKRYIIPILMIVAIAMPLFSFAQTSVTNTTTTRGEGGQEKLADYDPKAGEFYNGCTILNYNLRYGSNDAYTHGVALLQLFLQSKGYIAFEPTGVFGQQTLTGVQKFQAENGMESTGFVGPITRSKIQAMSCERYPEIVNTMGMTIRNGSATFVPTIVNGEARGGTMIFKFIATNPNNRAVYISNNPSIALSTSTDGSVPGAVSKLTTGVAYPAAISGDSFGGWQSGSFILPPGVSREFTYYGSIDTTNAATGLQKFTITAVHFGGVPSGTLRLSSVTTGLNGLMVSANISGGYVAPTVVPLVAPAVKKVIDSVSIIDTPASLTPVSAVAAPAAAQTDL